MTFLLVALTQSGQAPVPRDLHVVAWASPSALPFGGWTATLTGDGDLSVVYQPLLGDPAYESRRSVESESIASLIHEIEESRFMDLPEERRHIQEENPLCSLSVRARGHEVTAYLTPELVPHFTESDLAAATVAVRVWKALIRVGGLEEVYDGGCSTMLDEEPANEAMQQSRR